MSQDHNISLHNKIIPDSIREEAVFCLQHFPKLEDVHIEFRFRKRFKKSFMLAQPKIWSLFLPRKRRGYVIIMSRKFMFGEGKSLGIEEFPEDVLIGWLAHELGHIMDYCHRSTFQMIMFGLKYLLSGIHIKKAERAADVYAIEAGMHKYIGETKTYILGHSDLSDSYKAKIKKLYLGPEEISLIAHTRNPVRREVLMRSRAIVDNSEGLESTEGIA